MKTPEEVPGLKYEYKGAEVFEDQGSITAKFKTDTGANAEIVYKKPDYEVDPDAGTSVKVPGEFDYEVQEVGRINPDGDVDIDSEFEIIDSLNDVTKIADETFEKYIYKSPSNRVPTTEVQKAIRDKHLKEGGEHYSLSDETIDD